jgi:hypothetical protein
MLAPSRGRWPSRQRHAHGLPVESPVLARVDDRAG